MTDAQKVIVRVLAELNDPVYTTKLVKLIYLIDLCYFQHFGRTLTGFGYMWDQFGPNAVGHAIADEATKLAKQGLIRSLASPNIYGGISEEYRVGSETRAPALSPEAELVVHDVLRRYGRLGIRDLVAVSKKTGPFKKAKQYDVLRMEHSAQAERTTGEDWQTYQHEVAERGTESLEVVRERLRR